MSRQPRFEIVRTDAGWHARFRASNGQVVWTTEVYTRRKAARRAITGYADAISGGWWYLGGNGRLTISVQQDAQRDAHLTIASIEIREVDER